MKPETEDKPREKSWKRETGWAVFLIITAILLWIIHLHAQGHEMNAFIGLMTVAWPTSMGAVLGPTVLHHLRPHG